jgi:hypothetical protein
MISMQMISVKGIDSCNQFEGTSYFHLHNVMGDFSLGAADRKMVPVLAQ